MKDLKKYSILTALGIVGIASFYLVVVLSTWLLFQERAYPGVSVAGVSVAGKNKNEIKKILDEKITAYSDEKITAVSVKPIEKTPKELGIIFDTEKTAEEVVLKGAVNPFILGKKIDVPVIVKIEGDSAYKLINEQSESIKTDAKSADLKLESGELVLSGGDPGKRVNYADSMHNLLYALRELKKEFVVAEFSLGGASQINLTNEEKLEIIEKTKEGLTLLTPTKKYYLDQEKLLSFVTLSEKSLSNVMPYNGDEILFPGLINNSSVFSENKIIIYLSQIASEINFSYQNASLSTTDGKVTVATIDKDGQRLNLEKSALKIVDAIDVEENNVELIVERTKAEIRADNLEKLGLVGLVSTGYSNFSGSPTNRKHNIKTGASKFNGYLIRPGETFSFITVLGPVDASTGYLPELVIKENKTIPEYGGGMCQVSSTTFRAALNAGLPIIERTAHSYPVSYYKPYGVDATVYIPKPDLVFKNDTEKYILIQTRIVGNNLYFDFYGTKPTRTIKFAGNEEGTGAVDIVEKVSPLIYDAGVRGNGSFTAVVWRYIYDAAGKLVTTNKFTSKYDSPDKYPH